MQYTYRGAYLNALNEVIVAGLGADSVYLWTLPMFHCNGWCFPWAVTAASGTHVCLRQLDPGRVWTLLKQAGVTHYNASPTVQTNVTPDAPTLQAQRQPIKARPSSQPIAPSSAPWGKLVFSNGKEVTLSGEQALIGRVDHDAPRETVLQHLDDLADAVDVALHDVAAEAVGGPQRQLQVDRRPLCEGSQ